jgi:hypothetical protein
MLLKLKASTMALCAFLMCCASSVQAQSTINLTSSQQAEIWRSLGKRATRASEPAGLQVGEAVPGTMHVLSFARHVRKKVPAIRSYSYALLHGEVLIIDPRAKTIVAIVSK